MDPFLSHEPNFREIVAQAHEGIWVIDPAGRTTFANARMCDMLGYSTEELLGRVHTDLMFEADRPDGDVQMENRRVGTRETWDQRYRRKDGSELWTLATCCPIYKNGVFIGALGMFADITQRKALERALQESEARFRGTFENAAVGMAHVGLDGRWLRVNQRLCDLLGFTHDELMTVTFKDVTHPDELPGDLDLAHKVVAGAIPGYTLEKRYVRKDGAFFWGELSVSMLRDEQGRPLHFISVVKDITARKEALSELNRSREEMLAASQAKDHFLAILSHELRTPLTSVLLQAGEAAHDPEIPPHIREIFRSIEEAVTHQSTVIDDLLDLTRIASGKLHVRKEPLDLSDLLQSLILSLQPVAETKQLTLKATLPGGKFPVRGDPTRLRQIFFNLICNAIKFTPPFGQVEITLVLGSDGRQVMISIHDTGIGMTLEEQARLFQRFAQGDHAKKNPSEYGGLGLGLTITRSLIEQHGGTISASSGGRDCGSVFTVTLPITS